MRTKRTSSLAGGLVLALTLSEAAISAAELSGSALQNKIRTIRYNDTCERLVPPDHTSSYPLPVLVNKSRRYRVLYYSVVSASSQPDARGHVRPPAVVGRFDADAGDRGACEAFPMPSGTGEPTSTLGPRWPLDVRGFTMDQFSRQQRTLFVSLVRAATAYFEQSTDIGSQRVAQDFVDRFERLSEPGLRPYYRSLSPDFWEWVEGRTGKAF